MPFFRKLSLLGVAVALVLGTGCASKKVGVTPEKVLSELEDQGAVGWIHGSIESQGLYVFTYRNPKNFFDYLQMPLVSDDPKIRKQFAEFFRHDKVRIKGKYVKLPIPQKHIEVTSIELVKKFESPYASDPYHHDVKLPDDLMDKNTGTFLVHAIAADGHTLVVEYADTILPIFVKNTSLTEKLYRGDVVNLNFEIQRRPHEPVHLHLREDAGDAIQVVDPILALHGKPADVEGRLILFTKSPEISLNIFAVEATMPAHLMRQYTLANLEDDVAFQAILKKLQAAWDRHPKAYVNGRNKLVSTELRVRAKGIFNEVDPAQANAQIILKSADDIDVIEVPVEAQVKSSGKSKKVRDRNGVQ